MASLIVAADAAYPFDYSRLPKAVTAVLGYVGQPYCTPHVWTPDEVHQARNRGYLWAPIHTPPQAPFTRDMGQQAGELMVAELAGYPLLGGEPVFLDIERASYTPNPGEAMRGVAAWQAVMHAHGHRQAHAYLTWEAGSGWGANWTGTRPDSIPAGYVGWQYAGEVDSGRYDLSVFRPYVFQDLIDRVKGFPMNLDSEAQAWIVTQLNKLQSNLGERMSAYQWDNAKPGAEPHANVHLHQAITDLAARVGKLSSAPVDTAALATALAAALGPELATRTVAAIGKALTNG